MRRFSSRPVWIRFLLIVALAVCAKPVAAQSGASGRWQGAIELPGVELKIEVELAQGDSGWSGTISIPQQNLRNGVLEGIVVTGDSVRFTLAGVPGTPTFANENWSER